MVAVLIPAIIVLVALLAPWITQALGVDPYSLDGDAIDDSGGKPIGPMDPRYATSSRERQKATQQSEQKNVRNVAYWTPKLDEDNE